MVAHPSLVASNSADFLRNIDIPANVRPRLCVVVDTEEEFDWSAPFSRTSVGVTAVAEVWRLQELVEPLDLKPTYVVDYPVAATEPSARLLGELARRGRCDIGAHLHPWVNPPYRESISERLSFACNLGADLEMEKILVLKHAVTDGLGVVPTVYKAGRYGFGRTSALALEELGFDIDVSVNPCMDYSTSGGPSFVGARATPAFFGEHRRLLEIPCTTGFIGAARGMGAALHRAASRPWAAGMRALGILAKTGVLNRVMLSPEGSSLDEMIAVTRTLYRDGVRTFTLTFHSPSLKPGCTPYVRTTAERDHLLNTLRRYLAFFMGDLNGLPTTPSELFHRLSKGSLT